MPNSQGYNVTQSAWAMDADEDFINGPIYTSADSSSYTAGELQNDYSQCFGSITSPNDYASHFSKIAWTGSSETPLTMGSSGPVNMLQLPISPTTGSSTPTYPLAATSSQGIFMPPWNSCTFTNASEYLLWGGIINDDQRCGTQLYETFTSHSQFASNAGLNPATWYLSSSEGIPGHMGLRQSSAPGDDNWILRFGGSGTPAAPNQPRTAGIGWKAMPVFFRAPLTITFNYARGEIGRAHV